MGHAAAATRFRQVLNPSRVAHRDHDRRDRVGRRPADRSRRPTATRARRARGSGRRLEHTLARVADDVGGVAQPGRDQPCGRPRRRSRWTPATRPSRRRRRSARCRRRRGCSARTSRARASGQVLEPVARVEAALERDDEVLARGPQPGTSTAAASVVLGRLEVRRVPAVEHGARAPGRARRARSRRSARASRTGRARPGSAGSGRSRRRSTSSMFQSRNSGASQMSFQSRNVRSASRW